MTIKWRIVIECINEWSMHRVVELTQLWDRDHIKSMGLSKYEIKVYGI
jgi:hypothetical protein